MDKNVTKDIAIILLLIFLGFSAVLNVYYYVRDQAYDQQDPGLAVYAQKFGDTQVIMPAYGSPPAHVHQELQFGLQNGGWNIFFFTPVSVG